jgi:hypothetical protein
MEDVKCFLDVFLDVCPRLAVLKILGYGNFVTV